MLVVGGIYLELVYREKSSVIDNQSCLAYLGLTEWQAAGNEMCVSEGKVSWQCRCFTPWRLAGSVRRNAIVCMHGKTATEGGRKTRRKMGGGTCPWKLLGEGHAPR